LLKNGDVRLLHPTLIDTVARTEMQAIDMSYWLAPEVDISVCVPAAFSVFSFILSLLFCLFWHNTDTLRRSSVAASRSLTSAATRGRSA
jgi:hypothetical protein